MTKQRVTEILGEPDQYDEWNDAERFKYRLHPLDLPEQADISFTLADAAKPEIAQTVIEKAPMDGGGWRRIRVIGCR